VSFASHSLEIVCARSRTSCGSKDNDVYVTRVMVGTPKSFNAYVLAMIASSPSTDLNHAGYMMYDTVTACWYFSYI
jgi:hypothetical protein